MSNLNHTISYFEYTDNDYFGYVDCLNDFYQWKYPYPDYLNRNFLRKKILGGELLLTVAKDETGKIVGVSGAERQQGGFDGSVILTLRCVLKEYRGYGIGRDQEAFLVQKVHEKFSDAYSVFAEATTDTLASQASLYEHKFVVTGFDMMILKKKAFTEGAECPEDEKMALAIYASPIKGKDTIQVCVPSEHMAFVKNVYNELGVKVEELTSDTSSTIPEYYTRKMESQKTEEIYFTNPGDELPLELVGEINKLKKAGYTFIVYINICNNNAKKCYNELVNHKFYFAGVKPLCTNEYLVMANTEQCDYGYEKIIVPEHCEEKLKYVLGGKP